MKQTIRPSGTCPLPLSFLPALPAVRHHAATGAVALQMESSTRVENLVSEGGTKAKRNGRFHPFPFILGQGDR